jgi:hypothetical protein
MIFHHQKLDWAVPDASGKTKKLTRISAEQVMVEGELHPLAFTRGTVSFGKWIPCVILMLMPLASS